MLLRGRVFRHHYYLAEAGASYTGAARKLKGETARRSLTPSAQFARFPAVDGDALHVESYAGYKGEPTPRAFVHGGCRREVRRLVETWYTDHHCYFRVEASDAHRYVIRYEMDRNRWELVMQER